MASIKGPSFSKVNSLQADWKQERVSTLSQSLLLILAPWHLEKQERVKWKMATP